MATLPGSHRISRTTSMGLKSVPSHFAVNTLRHFIRFWKSPQNNACWQKTRRHGRFDWLRRHYNYVSVDMAQMRRHQYWLHELYEGRQMYRKCYSGKVMCSKWSFFLSISGCQENSLLTSYTWFAPRSRNKRPVFRLLFLVVKDWLSLQGKNIVIWLYSCFC